MIRRIVRGDEVNAAMTVALAGAIAVLLAKGDGPLSIGRVLAGTLSNPVPGGAAPGGTSRGVPADLGIAA